jgi:hypothetical protein
MAGISYKGNRVNDEIAAQGMDNQEYRDRLQAKSLQRELHEQEMAQIENEYMNRAIQESIKDAGD